MKMSPYRFVHDLFRIYNDKTIYKMMVSSVLLSQLNRIVENYLAYLFTSLFSFLESNLGLLYAQRLEDTTIHGQNLTKFSKSIIKFSFQIMTHG